MSAAHPVRIEKAANGFRARCGNPKCDWESIWSKLRVTARRYGRSHSEKMREEGK